MSVLQNLQTQSDDISNVEFDNDNHRKQNNECRKISRGSVELYLADDGLFADDAQLPSIAPSANILMIDDDLEDIYVTKRRLNESKVTNNFVYETNPKNVIETLSQMYIEMEDGANIIILLDINMPEVNGFEVLQSIKTNKLYKDIPVFMLCTSDDVVDMLETYEVGADGYLVKPIVTDEMFGFIQLLNSEIG